MHVTEIIRKTFISAAKAIPPFKKCQQSYFMKSNLSMPRINRRTDLWHVSSVSLYFVYISNFFHFKFESIYCEEYFFLQWVMRARWWKPVRLTKILATGTIYHLTIRGILNWGVAAQSEDRAVDLEGVVRSEHLYKSWLDRDLNSRFSRDVTAAMLLYKTIVRKVF